MRHMNEIARSLMTPPRESRLRKAALTFLVAASAAVFVGAPAGAIQITSSSPSGNYWAPVEVVEHMNNMVEIRTSVDFKRVEWTLGGTLKKTDNGTENGTDTTSTYIPSLNGIGRPWGIRRAVIATAYGNDNASASKTIWFRVWRPSNNIGIVKMTGPSDVVVGESFTVDLETNAGFGRVKWYLKEVRVVFGEDQNYGDLQDTSYGPYYKASFSHTFGVDEGSALENGKQYRITAKAYDVGNPSLTPVDTDVMQITVNVHEGKGKRAISGAVVVSELEIIKEGRNYTCKVNWWHDVSYYNDAVDAEALVYGWVKLYENDGENPDWIEVASNFAGDEKGQENHNHLKLDLALKYSGTVTQSVYRPMLSGKEPFRLRKRHRYKLRGNTGLLDTDDDVAVGPDINWDDRDNGQGEFWSEDREFDPELKDADEPLWDIGWNPVSEGSKPED